MINTIIFMGSKSISGVLGSIVGMCLAVGIIYFIFLRPKKCKCGKYHD